MYKQVIIFYPLGQAFKWYMSRLYPALAGYTTRYIPRERARSSEVEEAPRAKPEALSRLHESASPFPRDITGCTSHQHAI